VVARFSSSSPPLVDPASGRHSWFGIALGFSFFLDPAVPLIAWSLLCPSLQEWRSLGILGAASSLPRMGFLSCWVVALGFELERLAAATAMPPGFARWDLAFG